MLLFLLFLVELFVLFLLSRTLTRTLSYSLYHITRSKKLAVHVMAALFFPGTLIHELSHAFMAMLLRVHVGHMEFVPKIEGDKVKLGSVLIARTDFLRRFLIGAAPFLTGTAILLGVLFYAAHNQLFGNYQIVILLGYIVFEIGNTMFSSHKDMEGTVELLLTLLIITLIFYFLGVRLPAFSPDIIFNQPLVKNVLEKGCLFLLLPIAIDIVVIGLLKFLRK